MCAVVTDATRGTSCVCVCVCDARASRADETGVAESDTVGGTASADGVHKDGACVQRRALRPSFNDARRVCCSVTHTAIHNIDLTLSGVTPDGTVEYIMCHEAHKGRTGVQRRESSGSVGAVFRLE